jgi:hypothetical protein
MDTGLDVNAVVITESMRCTSLTCIRSIIVAEVASIAMSFDTRLFGDNAKSESR